jgi:hypothetical protein
MNEETSTFSSADPHAVEIGPGTESDLAAIVAILNYPIANSDATFLTEPVTVAGRRGWFEGFSAAGPHRLLVARRGSQMLGYAAPYLTGQPGSVSPPPPDAFGTSPWPCAQIARTASIVSASAGSLSVRNRSTRAKRSARPPG